MVPKKDDRYDRYSMKIINECIGDIGRARSFIFSTQDLTSGFWQLLLDKLSQHLTVPSLKQLQWIVSRMGLHGCQASFHRLVELAMREVIDVIVYIDNILITPFKKSCRTSRTIYFWNHLITFPFQVQFSKSPTIRNLDCCPIVKIPLAGLLDTKFSYVETCQLGPDISKTGLVLQETVLFLRHGPINKVIRSDKFSEKVGKF
jgi:hypothetical protein